MLSFSKYIFQEENAKVIPSLQYHATTQDRVEKIQQTGLILPTTSTARTYIHGPVPTISTADEPQWCQGYGPVILEFKIRPGAKYIIMRRPTRGKGSLQDLINEWIDKALQQGADGVYVGQGLQSSVGNQTINPAALVFNRIIP